MKPHRVGLAGLAIVCLAGAARADLVTLPTTLDQLLPMGKEVVVGPFTFSQFSFAGDLQAYLITKAK